MKPNRNQQPRQNDIVQFVDDRIVIGPVMARWPRLDEKNSRSGDSRDGKYELAILIDSKDSRPLNDHLQLLLEDYLARNPASAKMERKLIGEEMANGQIKFELQNRKIRPDVYDEQGQEVSSNIADRSKVKVVVQAQPYTNNLDDSPFTGVSLRLLAVQVIEEPPSNLDLLMKFAEKEAANDDFTDDIEFDDIWDN